MPKPPSKKWVTRAERVRTILPVLKRAYPGAKCSLDYTKPLELLVATILSAQCTDDRVNIVTQSLFKKYRTAKAYATAPPDELEKDIQSTGFYRNKAKSLRGMGRALVDEHGGEVPRTMDELTALAGVGRKTANVVLGNAFGIDVGVVVDTHVGRLSRRLDLTDHDDPVDVEQDLMRVIPKGEWTIWAHLMIAHGRAICQARKPKCPECPILKWCPTGQANVAGG
ncbi:MAG TPA: endonuclease III [Tepidisphaeraceae bacterium]|nr:endonuclease III [Tepidisphaeraceae bacterium]